MEAQQAGKLQQTIDELCRMIDVGLPRVTIIGRTRTLVDLVIKPRVLLTLAKRGIKIKQDKGSCIITDTDRVICFRSVEYYQGTLADESERLAILD